MKISILIFSFCALLNTVTSSPYNIGNAKLQNVKPGYLSHTSKLPEKRNFTSKAYDIKKSAKDSNLTNLLNGTPFTKTNDTNMDVLKHVNETSNKEQEDLNLNKTLYADELEMETEKLDTETQKIHEIKKENKTSTFSDSNFPKKFSKHDESNKIGRTLKSKTSKDQLKPLELPPSMIRIFKPNTARSQAKIENLEPVSNIFLNNIPTQEAFIDTPTANIPNQDANPNINGARSTIPVPDFIPDAAKPVPPNEQLSPPIHLEAAENVDDNLNPMTKGTKFDIPCQKASDVLEITPVKSEHCLRQNLEPKSKEISINIQEQKGIEKIEKLETDESVAIVFKPKNISMFNVYGDLLKKITLTVLVPYHISKLGT